jgi:hypothetical protein
MLRYFALRDESNVGAIKMFYWSSTQVVETINSCHKIILNDVPADFVKGSSEAVWPWGLVTRHLMDCVPDLSLREWQIEAWIKDTTEVKSIPV